MSGLVTSSFIESPFSATLLKIEETMAIYRTRLFSKLAFDTDIIMINLYNSPYSLYFHNVPVFRPAPETDGISVRTTSVLTVSLPPHSFVTFLQFIFRYPLWTGSLGL